MKVFDNSTLNILYELEQDGYISDLSVISEGKEAIVFRSGKYAIKIYKVMNRSYKDQINYIKKDPRFRSFPKTVIGIIYTWVKKEYINLRRMYKNLVKVPIPYTYKGNILVMKFIGDENPAPLLHDYGFDNKEIFYKILEEYKKIYQRAKLVHGDLSEYNILIYKDVPYIIDVSQAIPTNSLSAKEFLDRDINNMLSMARKFKISINEEEIRREIES